MPNQQTPETLSNREAWLKELGSKETQKILLRYIYYLGMKFSPEEIEDIAQESLLKATKAIQEGKFNVSLSKLRSWLQSIAKNTALDLLRRKKIRQSTVSLTNKHELSSSEPTPREELITKEVDKNLESLRNNLPQKQREVLDLLESGKSLEEIAKLKGVSINTVKSRKRYATQSLKKDVKTEEEK